MRARGMAGVVAGLLAVATLSCGDDPTGPSNAPENHTVVQDGVRHAPGLNNPITNCTSCHGADLRGGSQGQPSCFSCHGQKWP